MQRRVIFGRLPLSLTLLTCLALPLSAPAALAQTPASDSTWPQAHNEADAPQLLLVIRRDAKLAARDEATRSALQDAVHALMRDSGHYQVRVYHATDPLVKRALTEHSISSIDLSEPLQIEGMRHVATVLGIRTILFLTPTFDKTGLSMEAQLHQNVGQDTWQAGVTGQITPNLQFAKRRLNQKETVAVAVDGLASLLQLPSHMAADLNLKAMETAMETKKPVKNGSTSKEPTRAVQNSKTQGGNTPDKQANPPIATDTNPPAIPNQPSKQVQSKEPTSNTAKNNKQKNGVPSGQDALAGLNNAAAQTVVPTQGGVVYRPETPTPPVVPHQNYETLSDHYHDNRDLANTITYLRYAVNERPRDIPLRRKLILAYQEHKMPETALAEIGRALQIAPNESSLYRAYGETLMTKGDVPGAQKAFRDAIRLNTDDIQSRISLGDALMADNQYAEALETYTAAQKADPRSPLPHRRLARVLLLRASSDPSQYAASLDEIGKARELTPKTDTSSYQEDYGTLMQISESRLRELLEEISGNFVAYTKGKQNVTDTQRALSDMKLRTDAISSYLEKAPPAAGQGATHINYQQASTLVLQSLALFNAYLAKNDSATKQQMQDASTEAYQELDTAHKRLASIRATLLPK